MKLSKMIIKLYDLSTTQGTNAKIEHLSWLFKRNQDFINLFYSTYNTKITYGLRNLTKHMIGNYGKQNKSVLSYSTIGNILSCMEGKTSASKKDIEYILKELKLARVEEIRLVEDIFQRNLNVGLNIKGINKAYHKNFGRPLIPQNSLMLAQKFDEKKLEFPSYVEPKYDGIRILIRSANKEISIFTRSFRQADEKFPEIVDAISKMGQFEGYVLDCEVVSKHKGFQDVMTRTSKKPSEDASEILVHVFDIIPIIEFDMGECSLVLKDRVALLNKKFQVPDEDGILFPIDRFLAHKESKMYEIYEQLAKVYEGAVIKPLAGLYEYKRSSNWMKLKPFLEIDAIVTGIEEGKRSFKGTTGNILCSGEGHERIEVGTGLTKEQRAAWWKDPSLIIGKTVEVRYQEVTDEGNPRFASLRRIKQPL